LLADIYIARGEPYQAIDLLTRTLQEGVTHRSVVAKLGITYVWVGEFDKAAQVLRGFEGTNDLTLLMAFGRLELSRQQWAKARGYFERALVLDPKNPTIKLNLGQIALAEGRLSEARTLLQESLAADLNSFEGWSALGMVFARQGDAGGAVMAWERAREVNPDMIDILYNLGLGHAQLGNLNQAIGYLEDYAARAQPGPQLQQALEIAQRLRLQASQRR
jgi:predicted Zn-dependent protease